MQIYILKEGQQFGPLAEGIVRQMIRDGRLAPEDLAIRYAGGWQSLADLFPDEIDVTPVLPFRTMAGPTGNQL